MKLREALIAQSPSLALQRAAADEIARLDAHMRPVEYLHSLVAPDPEKQAMHRERGAHSFYNRRRFASLDHLHYGYYDDFELWCDLNDFQADFCLDAPNP